MSKELKIPSPGESITEVMVGDWLKEEGEWVRVDDIVVVVESDKVNLELPAPIEGKLIKKMGASGDTMAVGDVIAVFEEGQAPAIEEARDDVQTSADSTPVAASDKRVMPSAARVLAEKGLSADQVPASGPGGRLLKEDVLRHPQPISMAPKPAAPVEGGERRVRMTPLRKTVARRLVEAQQTAALLTTFNEVDMSAIKALRKSHQEAFVGRYGIKLGFMSFFVKAVVDALAEYPALNATIEGEEIVYRDFFDIGVAVGGGKGLVVPVIRQANRLSFAEVEMTINDFGRRAKDNKIRLDELTGGTFSITNGGVYGSLLSTPIINPPQSGILGMHGIQDRPVAINGEVVIRPMMYIALTYDHRLVDGREAVSFLKRIKECVESPVRLLLEV